MSQSKAKSEKLTTIMLPEHLAKATKDSKQPKQPKQQQQQVVKNTPPEPVAAEEPIPDSIEIKNVHVDTLCGIATVLQRETNMKKPKFIPHIQSRPPQWRISQRLPFLLQEVIYATIKFFIDDWINYSKKTDIDRIPSHLALTIHRDSLWKTFIQEIINQQTLTDWEEQVKYKRVEIVKEVNGTAGGENKTVNETILSQFEPDIIPTSFHDKIAYFYSVMNSLSKGMVTKSYSKLPEKPKAKKRKSSSKTKEKGKQNKKSRTKQTETKNSKDEKQSEDDQPMDEDKEDKDDEDDQKKKETTKSSKDKDKKQTENRQKAKAKAKAKTNTKNAEQTETPEKRQNKRTRESNDDDDVDDDNHTKKNKQTSNRKKETIQSEKKRK